MKPASREVKAAAEELNCASASDRSIVVSDQFLSILVAQLSGDDVEVSSNAAEVITICCRRLGSPMSNRSIQAICTAWQEVRGNISIDRSRNSTISVRCASAIVDIAVLEDANMEIAISSKAMNQLLSMVTDASDPLLAMSSLDLVEQLAVSMPMHGNRARWLFSAPLLNPLLQMAGGGCPDEDPDPILGGSALRLLSALCRLGQRDSTLFGLGGSELLTGFYNALQKFDGSGELERLAFIDAVSSFASASPDALELVLNDPIVREGWLSLSVAQPKLKSVVMKSVANVLDPPAEIDASGDLTITSNIPTNAMALKLFSSVGLVNDRDATELILSLAKSTIEVLRFGAYSLLEAVARRGTGSQMLLSHGGFFEFLIHMEGETVKEGKEAKFKIIEAVMKSEARGLLADNIVTKLEKILDQGPFYIQTEKLDVMTE
uniref:26S proteasome non-ATPase regulatory subunit 5 n=2 Tax=Asterionellopsis glacialis TaxID=33640 RepID=A0A7S0PU21_9STRA